MKIAQTQPYDTAKRKKHVSAHSKESKFKLSGAIPETIPNHTHENIWPKLNTAHWNTLKTTEPFNR